MASQAKAWELPWAKVERGMRVELGGKVYVVDKVKPKGKRVKVTVTGQGSTFTSEVKAKDLVTAAHRETPKRKPGKTIEGPQRDERGRGLRWATEKEHDEVLGKGDPTVTKRPDRAVGSPWDAPVGKAERALADILGAHLVGEANDTAVGYYVPPQDITTVAAHMMLFHGGDAWAEHGEAKLLEMHELQHEQARTSGATFAVNHWHTKVRP